MRICPHVKFDAKTSRDTARRPVFQKTQRDAKTRSPALTPVINETPAGHKPNQSTQYHLYCTFPLIKSQGNFLIFVYGGGTQVGRREQKIRAAQTVGAEIMVYAYRLDAANRQIGICRTVRTCHSEPVRTLVWESPSKSEQPIVIQAFLPAISRNSSMRNGASNRGIATPVCALARNDREFDTAPVGPTNSNL